MKFENLVEICFWLNLAVKRLKNKYMYDWFFAVDHTISFLLQLSDLVFSFLDLVV